MVHGPMRWLYCIRAMTKLKITANQEHNRSVDGSEGALYSLAFLHYQYGTSRRRHPWVRLRNPQTLHPAHNPVVKHIHLNIA